MSCSQRTAILKAIPCVIHPIIGHTLTCVTDGRTVIADGNCILNTLLPATPPIEIDERIDIPDVPEKAVSGHIIMSGIETDVFEV